MFVLFTESLCSIIYSFKRMKMSAICVIPRNVSANNPKQTYRHVVHTIGYNLLK